MATKEQEVVTKNQVKCSGGEGPLGHPAIYLNLSGKESIECPYCSKQFIKNKS